MTDDKEKPDTPQVARLKAMGFRLVRNTGQGFGMPWVGPPPAKPPEVEEKEATHDR